MTLRILAALPGLGFLILAGGAMAAPLFGQAEPARAWQCLTAAQGETATLYLFDTPLAVDRYSPDSGLDSVAEIDVAVMATGKDGAPREYTFGTFELDYQAYAITMVFSARIAAGGPRL